MLSEFYLHDAAGHELGVKDLNAGTWNWYVFGTQRFARITPDGDHQPVNYNMGHQFDSGNNSEENLYPFAYTTYANTDLSKVTYYVHDHLGNLRVAYTPTVVCQGGGGGNMVSAYKLENVLDYFPTEKSFGSMSTVFLRST